MDQNKNYKNNNGILTEFTKQDFGLFPLKNFNDMNNNYSVLLACAITHQSHIQGTVLEPCPRHTSKSMSPWIPSGGR